MSKLLGHSIASSNRPEYEQSMLWSVALVAFWGSLRLSELLCEERFCFNEKYSLMTSDLFINKESIGIWLCSEKIASEYGNVVEIWSFDSRPDLDPVCALSSFLERRSNIPSEETLPVFIWQDGSNLSKSQFNKILKELLSIFPEFANSSRDFWAGHSFRSGLPTLLQGLGFHEEEIKGWGRWKSMAYQAYLKDFSARRKTKEKLTHTFLDIFKSI